MTNISGQTISDSIINRIQKCLALGKSPNENEAKLAITNANKLLTKYNLSMTDVTIKEDENREIGEASIDESKTLATWKSNLLYSIADNNYCKYIVRRFRLQRKVQLILIGRKHNVIIVKNMYDYLVEIINKWASRFEGKGRTNKNSYRMGMVAGISDRLTAERKKAEEHGIEVDGEHCTALVVRNLYERENKTLKKWIDETYKKLGKESNRRNNIDCSAYTKGVVDSKNISLNRQVSNRRNRKQIR